VWKEDFGSALCKAAAGLTVRPGHHDLVLPSVPRA